MVYFAKAQVTVLFEGFEGNFPADNGWIVRDANPSGSPGYWDDVNGSFGGEGTHSGNWKGYCAGSTYPFNSSEPNPSYQDSMTATMSRDIDLSGYCSATLTFWHKLPSIETCGEFFCDVCRVIIQSPLCVGCGPGVGPTVLWLQGNPVTDWTPVTIDLTPYVGGTYTLKFEFTSDGSITYEGWYLDDISVTATIPPPGTNVTINFEALPAGTEVTNQYPGVEFSTGPAGERIPVIEQVPAGTASSGVNVLNITRPFAEFTRSYVLGNLTKRASRVSVAAGYFAYPSSPGDAANLTLRAFSSQGLVGSQTAIFTEGQGFHRILAVNSCLNEIVSFTVEANPDYGKFGLDDVSVSFADGDFPDFALEGPPGVTLVQGGPAVDVPVTIRRIGGSSGAVGFALGQPPAGVSASVIPNPASGNSAVLRLRAAMGPHPEMSTLAVTGNPVTPDAGPPGPRTLSIFVQTAPNLRVSGRADIDFATGSPSGTHGTISQDYVVVRHPSVSGPISIGLEGLPADVTGTVDPPVLGFAAGALGERMNVRLTTIAGLTIPNTWAALHLTGPGIDLSFPILLHGRCPQQGRNFVIRGEFLCINEGVSRPVSGAQVQIYRNVPLWWDDHVDTTYTDNAGRFSRELSASEDGDYYARLRLFSPEVQVVDAENSQVWSIETRAKSNRAGLIDLGSLEISSDNGAGSPRAAVWQGFQNAVLEFRRTTGHGIPQGQLNVEIWRGHVTPLTFYDEVHWAHGYHTGDSGDPYRVTFHEFGHAFRHVLDGSFAHWSYDNGTFIYGRTHGYCGSALVELEGFAFNEGWAEYWSGDTDCCDGKAGDPTIEGTVAHHLSRLASCVLTNGSVVGRKGMVQVLERGEDLIHSIGDFRREFVKQFPGCPLGSISDGCPLPSPAAKAAAAPLAAAGPAAPLYPVLDAVEQRARLVAAIDARASSIASLQEQQLSSTGLRAFALRAAVEEGNLVWQRMRDELAELDGGSPPEAFLQQVFAQRLRQAEFVSQRKAIQMQALRDALEAVPVEQRPAIEQRMALLEGSSIEDDSLGSMIPLPALAGVSEDSIPPTCLPAPNGLVSWWPAAGSASDVIGHNHGAPLNGTAFVDGKVGRAFSFDGVDDKLLIGGAPISPPWTAELWVNRQASSDDSAILLGDGATALKLEQWPNTRLVGFTQFGVADYSFNYSAPVGAWVHLAFVAAADKTQIYVNGALQDSVAATIALPLGQVGADIDGRFVNRLRGLVDELSVYNRPLSASEIHAIYAADTAGKCLNSPYLLSIEKSGAGVTLVWSAQRGLDYRVQYKTSLDPSVGWADLSGDVSATSDTATKTDSNLGGALQRFYRVVVLR